MIKTNVKKPFQLIIFGASGDLAFLKLFPAIYDLFIQKRLPDKFEIIGYGRTKLSKKDFQNFFKKSLTRQFGKNPSKFAELAEHLYYFSGSYDQLESYQELNQFCLKLSGQKSIEQVAYFSVPPFVFNDLILNLSKTLKKVHPELKIVIEKPFGTSEKTATDLAKHLHQYFHQKNVYMLDHYLGKIPVKSILKLRMENNVINQLLDGDLISNIQLTAFETAHIGQRISYFEHTGIIRDMIQSHLLQVLTLITMDIPIHPNRESIQREKYSLLSALRFSGKKEDLVTAQFDGYQKLEGVEKKSTTDTFAAVKLTIDQRRWFNVPIILRAGKRLGKTATRAVIEFKKLPFQDKNSEANKLVFEMKPEEKMELVLYEDARHSRGLKGMDGTVSLAKNLACIGDECLTEYGTLILDILNSKKDYFLGVDEVLASWKVTDEIMRTKARSKLLSYQPGTLGPKEQHDLARKNQINWYEG